MRESTILLVDDDASVRRLLAERLKEDGDRVLEAGTGAQARRRLSDHVDLVLLDSRLPDDDGLVLLQAFKEEHPELLVILLAADATVEVAVQAMKLGAYHVARKPVNAAEIARIVDAALETTRLRRELKELRASASRGFGVQRIVGCSPAMVELRELIVRVAESAGSTVLIRGESGTGKDLVANVIHFSSGRAGKPFVNITCSAIPEQLLESQLFGHERGAFTDARTQSRGLVESADGGTVFLDEIGDMSPMLQAKLLRFLEERAFRRVGGTSDLHVDVRVIAATNRNLEAAVEKGEFRGDLFYRLDVLPITIPPLRSRPEDIPLLVEHFIESFNKEFRRSVVGATMAAQALLQRYGWPGNVRELRNIIERAMLLSDRPRLDVDDFAALATPLDGAERFTLPEAGVNMEQLERSLVAQALRRSHGNQTKAAELLGLNRDQIRYRIEKFGLSLSR
jgi:DNA-binding NtrC family response regulator